MNRTKKKMVMVNKFQNENDLEESDKAALGFRATGARGGIFGIRTLAKSPPPPTQDPGYRSSTQSFGTREMYF